MVWQSAIRVKRTSPLPGRRARRPRQITGARLLATNILAGVIRYRVERQAQEKAGRQTMRLDFTMERYRDLCQAIVQSGYTPMTVRGYLEAATLPARLAVVRHDVDSTPRQEPRIAGIEDSLGIRATYYFRHRPGIFRPDVMRRLASMGHEVGYHYEAMDKGKGDSARAIDIFSRELADFREVVEIRTISMHGNPLTRWDNRDLWRDHDFRSFGLAGEAYLSFDRSRIGYLSDTGRTWGPEYKVKDWLPPRPGSSDPPYPVPRVRSTDDLIALLRSRQCDHLYLNTHAGRWADGSLEWTRDYALDQAVRLVKRVLALKRRLTGKTG